MFEIIKNAELPARKRGPVSIYPFASMEVGDGFDAPRDMGEGKNGGDKRQHAICSTANNWVKRYNPTAKFTTRLMDENTVRCVRTA